MIRHIYNRYYVRTHVYVLLLSVKKHVFDLEDDLVGVPNTWYVSAQAFITLVNLV